MYSLKYDTWWTFSMCKCAIIICGTNKWSPTGNLSSSWTHFILPKPMHFNSSPLRVTMEVFLRVMDFLAESNFMLQQSVYSSVNPGIFVCSVFVIRFHLKSPRREVFYLLTYRYDLNCLSCRVGWVPKIHTYLIWRASLYTMNNRYIEPICGTVLSWRFKRQQSAMMYQFKNMYLCIFFLKFSLIISLNTVVRQSV